MSIGNSQMRQAFTGMGMNTPSEAGMHKQGRKVAKLVERMCEESFEEERNKIKAVFRKVGLPESTPIPASFDTQYNIGLRDGAGRNPGQPATQATTSAVENFSANQKILGVYTANKHCTCIGECGENCTRNMDQTAVIGDEGLYVGKLMSAMLIDKSPTAVSYATTDGDSRSFSSASKTQTKLTGIPMQNLKDIRHLNKSLRKKITNSRFSQHMFPGRTKDRREFTKRRFILDIIKRINIEFDKAMIACDGNIQELTQKLLLAREAIISCYSGDCTLCTQHSFVCNKVGKKIWARPFMPMNGKEICMDETDKRTLRLCINVRLSKQSIEKTRFNSSTQKNEAIHRAYLKSNPKAVLFKRMFPARVKSAAHRVNRGIGNSMAEKLAAVGAPILPGSKTAQILLKMQMRELRHKKRQKSAYYRYRRTLLIGKRFMAYDTSREAGTYKKDIENISKPVKLDC